MSLPLRLLCLLTAAALALPALTFPALALSTKEDEKAGAVLFRDKGCAYCHGERAQGTAKAPGLADIRKKWKPEQIEGQIVNGGQKMPAFEDSLSKQEVQQLIAYLRAKHRPIPPPAPAPSKPETSSVINSGQ